MLGQLRYFHGDIDRRLRNSVERDTTDEFTFNTLEMHINRSHRIENFARHVPQQDLVERPLISSGIDSSFLRYDRSLARANQTICARSSTMQLLVPSNRHRLHLAELEDHEQVRQTEESIFRFSFSYFFD